jgi:DNA polymerase IV
MRSTLSGESGDGPIRLLADRPYASVEQRDNSELRGRPVAVGHGAKRGVVAAASYEARAFGVRSAMPSITAMRQCAELVFVPPRFEVYRAVSRQVHAIFGDYTGLIEPLSLDEAYLDVTQDLRGLQTASAAAKEIRARILEETGLTASAGISYNKFLAKLASSQRKPNGQFVITPEMGPNFIALLPVARSWRRACHCGKDGATRHSSGRGSESEVACLSAAAFRQIGRLVSRHRERCG